MSFLLLLGGEEAAPTNYLTLPNDSFESADLSAYAATGPGVTVNRVSYDEAPDGSHVLEVTTGGVGWSGLDGVRTVESVEAVPSAPNAIRLLVWAAEGREIFPSIDERDADDNHIAWHEGDAFAGTGLWEILEFAGDFGPTGVQARVAFHMDGPGDFGPVFMLDRLPDVWPAPFPALRLKDGFETGDFSAWTAVQEVGDTAEAIVSPSDRIAGNYSARFTLHAGDERSEIYKITERTSLVEGDEMYIRFRSRLEGDPAGITTLMQIRQAGSEGSPIVELNHHQDSGRMTFGGGPAVGVPHSIDWWGPPAADLIGEEHEWIVHVKFSNDPDVGFVELWMDREQQTLTAEGGSFIDQINDGGLIRHRSTWSTFEEATFAYPKIGNYGPATATGTHVVDDYVLSEDPADAFVEYDPEPVEPFNVLRYPVQTQGKCTVRLLALDGTWETVGADRVRGVRHEALSASSNRKGSDTCRLILKRQPGGVFPDLTAATPCEIINSFGTLVWAGRVKETPSSGGDDFSIGVEGEGWQYHLYDDVFERLYVHTRLSDWKDWRSSAEADLATFITKYNVGVDGGAITLTWPGGEATAGGSRAYFDAGPDATISRMVVDYESSAGASNNAIYLLCSNSPDFGDATTQIIGFLSAGTHTYSWALPVASRYVAVQFDLNGHTPTNDEWVKFTGIKLFYDAAYESGGESVFRAHHGIRDALTFAPLLSQDTSLIQETSFDIPDYAMTDDRKPGESMEALNALHNWVLKVRTDMRLEYRPLPSIPLFRVGQWAGADFKDASKNSLEDIYNRSIVKGTGADGAPLKVNRYAAQQPDTYLQVVSSPAFDNPSFAVDTTGWTSTTGSVSRTTTPGEFASAPAGLKWTLGDNDTLVGQLSGSFVVGATYVVEFLIRHNLGGIEVASQFLFGGTTDFARDYAVVGATFVSGRVTWRPRATHSGASLRIPVGGYFGGSGIAAFLDSCALSVVRPTIPNRRGFTRTHVHSMSQAMIPEVGQQIADTFLATHKRTPLKGDISVKGRGGVRRYLGDATVPPSELLIHTNELVHLSDQIDPDTGALGRDAPIDTVTWTEDEDSATVSLDSQRDNLAVLLARYDLVAGTGSS